MLVCLCARFSLLGTYYFILFLFHVILHLTDNFSDKGIVRQATMNDLPVGRSVDETLRLVKAFQYTDTHDVVCLFPSSHPFIISLTSSRSTLLPFPSLL